MKLYKRILPIIVLMFSFAFIDEIRADEGILRICTYQHSSSKELATTYVIDIDGIMNMEQNSGDIYTIKNNEVQKTDYGVTEVDLNMKNGNCECPPILVIADMTDYDGKYCARYSSARGSVCAQYKEGALPKKAFLINNYSDLNGSRIEYEPIKIYCEEKFGVKAGAECIKNAGNLYAYTNIVDSVCGQNLTSDDIVKIATSYSEAVEADCSDPSSKECHYSKLRFEALKNYVEHDGKDPYLKLVMENFDKEDTYMREVNITYGCGLIQGETADIMSDILFILRLAGPLIAIFLGAWDFATAIVSSEDDAFKKAGKRFIRRIFAAALLFLLPLIIEFLLTGIDYSGTTDGIFCGLE